MPEAEQQEISDSSKGPLMRDLAVGPHGNLVAAIGSGNEFPLLAVSYRSNGALDPRFGKDGFVRAEFSRDFHSDSQARGVAVQRDGKIVLVGYQLVTPLPMRCETRHPLSFDGGSSGPLRPSGRVIAVVSSSL